MMSKTELHEVLRREVAKSAIRKTWDEYDDEWFLWGKWSRSDLMRDGNWSVWICNTKDLAEGLSNRKVSSVLKKLHELAGDFTETLYEGEAAVTLTTDQLLLGLSALGVKRAPRVSPEQRERAIARMRTVRQAQSTG